MYKPLQAEIRDKCTSLMIYTLPEIQRARLTGSMVNISRAQLVTLSWYRKNAPCGSPFPPITLGRIQQYILDYYFSVQQSTLGPYAGLGVFSTRQITGSLKEKHPFFYSGLLYEDNANVSPPSYKCVAASHKFIDGANSTCISTFFNTNVFHENKNTVHFMKDSSGRIYFPKYTPPSTDFNR